MKKKMRKHASIKWKIFLFMLLFSLLMLVILWLFQTVFLDSFYKSIKLSEVEREAGMLAEYIRDGDMDALGEAVRQRGDVFVEIFDEDGNSYTVPGNYPEIGPNQLSMQQKQQIFEETRDNGGTLTVRSSSDLDVQPEDLLPFLPGPQRDDGGKNDRMFDDMQNHGGFNGRMQERILYTQIVMTPDGTEELLMVTAEITPVNATVEALRIQLIWISGIMVVLAVGLALLISRNVSRPIEKLNGAAQELGRGNYGVTFDAGGYREVDELSGTLGRAAKELSRTEELRRELIANVSHDLRTPLTLITGYAEMMRDIPGEDTPENMQVIIDEANRLSGLVGDLLDLSRIQSGTMEMRFERFSLTGETADIVERFARFCEPEGFTVTFEDGEDLYVEADVIRIGQVVYNFLVNAMLHSGEGDKHIAVHERKEDGRVRIEVADTGGGIRAEDMPHIWDRYYKVDAVHKRSTAGTGLGLSIVKNILEQHPGVQYGVESEEGKGSTFWFSLPLA